VPASCSPTCWGLGRVQWSIPACLVAAVGRPAVSHFGYVALRRHASLRRLCLLRRGEQDAAFCCGVVSRMLRSM
jgi:hypothetical protein